MFKTTSLFFVLVLFINASYAQITNGLVSKYTFSGNANDLIGSNSGAVSGAVLTSGHLGNPNSAYKFDGFSGDNIDLGTGNSIKTTSMTISLWVLIDSNQYYYQGFNYQPFIISRNPNYPATYFESYTIGYYRPTSKFVTATYNVGSGGGPEAFGLNTVNLKQWYHLVMTFDNDSLAFYVDTVLQSKKHKGFTTTYAASSPVLIGKSGNAAKEGYLNGKIDDLLIYNRVLSKQEISSLYYFTGINDPNNITSKLFIFPNPTANSISISGIDIEKISRMGVTNSIGQIVIDIPEPKENIDVSKLAPGIYFLNILDNSENQSTLKFSKE